MDELNTYLPADADDLSKHAPALFALKGTETGLVVPALYFEELSELIISKTMIPEDGGLIVPENYFEETTEQILAKTSFGSASASLSTGAQDDNYQPETWVVPENYFEELPSIIEAKASFDSASLSTGAQDDNYQPETWVVPENYFNELAANIESQIAVENVLQKTEGEIPQGYFTRLESELNAHLALDNLKQDEGFVVPQNYFEKITEQIVDANSAVKLSGAEVDANAHDDQVPVGYFDSLHDKVVARIESESGEEKGRVIVFSEWKKYAAVTAVAASVALLIAFAWTFMGTDENGSGTLLVASNNMNYVPENGAKEVPQPGIDSVPVMNVPVVDGIAVKTPKKPGVVKPKPNPEVIMSDEEIIAQTDLMDESLVIEFVAENGVVETTDNVLDPAMMEYLMNDNSGFEIFVPADKKK